MTHASPIIIWFFKDFFLISPYGVNYSEFTDLSFSLVFYQKCWITMMAAGSTRTLERRQPVLTDFQLQISGHISLKRSTSVDYFLIFFNFNYFNAFWGRVAWETELLHCLRNETVTRRPQRNSFLRYLPCLSLWCLSDTYCNTTARNRNALSVVLQLVMPLFTADFDQNFASDWLRRHQQLKQRNFFCFCCFVLFRFLKNKHQHW